MSIRSDIYSQIDPRQISLDDDDKEGYLQSDPDELLKQAFTAIKQRYSIEATILRFGQFTTISAPVGNILRIFEYIQEPTHRDLQQRVEPHWR